MNSNEDKKKTWISHILVRNIFLCLKQVYCCLTFVCVYIFVEESKRYFLVSVTCGRPESPRGHM